jgi:hypothetical protein
MYKKFRVSSTVVEKVLLFVELTKFQFLRRTEQNIAFRVIAKVS